MEITEHSKLIYQLSRVYNSGMSKDSLGLVYPKNPLMECSITYNIWAKRAYKKGYLDLVEETSEFRTYKINSKGLALLKNFPDYYLHRPNNYNIFITQQKPKKHTIPDEIKRQRRRERRRLRKLKGVR